MTALQTAAYAGPGLNRIRCHGTGAAHSLEARFACDRKTRMDAFALRHASYLADGHIDPAPDGLFSDSFDDAPNSQTVVVYKAEQAIASVRACILESGNHADGSIQIPAESVFQDEIANLLGGQPLGGDIRRALEINRLVRHPDFSSEPSLVCVLFLLVDHMVVKNEADVVLSCVRPHHVPFYRRMGFEQIAGPRRYHGVKFAACLLACSRPSYNRMRQVANLPPRDSLLDPIQQHFGRGEPASALAGLAQ